MTAGQVFHFSEDATIARFEPHVPASRPEAPPLVWAIDEAHAPLYWFPRDCPRVTVWARDARERELLRRDWSCEAHRLHSVEQGWMQRIASTTVHRYAFDRADFEAWPDADGHWVSRGPVEPLAVEPLPNLLGLHADAGVELRSLPLLWAAHDIAAIGRLPFSIVRMRNALPR